MRELGQINKQQDSLKTEQFGYWLLLLFAKVRMSTRKKTFSQAVVVQLRRICFCSDVSHRLEPGSLSFSFKTIYSCLKLEIERTVERITPQWRSGSFSWCPSWLAWTAWSQKQTHLSRPLKAHQRGKLLFMRLFLIKFSQEKHKTAINWSFLWDVSIHDAPLPK